MSPQHAALALEARLAEAERELGTTRALLADAWATSARDRERAARVEAGASRVRDVWAARCLAFQVTGHVLSVT